MGILNRPAGGADEPADPEQREAKLRRQLEAREQAERAARARSGAADPHVQPLDPEPPNTPRQQGHLPADRAALIRLQLQLADSIRTQLLGASPPLDWPLQRTTELESKARAAIEQMLGDGRLKIPRIPPSVFIRDVLAEIFGLGPIQDLVDADGLNDILVNGPYIVFIERQGRLIESGRKFLDADHVERIIRRIVNPLGIPADHEHPLVDARLPGGSRVNAVLRPIALDGPSISIRKFPKKKLAFPDLIQNGTLTKDIALFLEALVVSQQSIVVSGGTGSGKTTMVNCLAGYIPPGERIVTIEDTAELNLNQRNVVRMETKRPSSEAPCEVTTRDCVRNALRMRPDRIIVGECRGGEAMDMLQAMNTGHDGSMTTVHANDPRSCLARIETMAMMASMDLPVELIRRQIATSVSFVIQVDRLRDGTRKVTQVCEITGMEADTVSMQKIFEFVEEGQAVDGRVVGVHAAQGIRPRCDEVFKRFGVNPGDIDSRTP